MLVRTIATKRLLRDLNDELVPLDTWKIEHLAEFGACHADGRDRWSHTATVTLYTDGVYGIACGNGHDIDHTHDLAGALRAAEKIPCQ